MKCKERDTSYSNFVMKLMLVCTILILGSAIIFSFNTALGHKDTKEEENIEKDTNKSIIDTLYGYITFNRDVEPTYYFYQNNELNYEKFDALEKVRYAFGLLDEKQVTKKDDRTYSIDAGIYNGYIETIFGKNTVHDNSKEVVIMTNKIVKNSIMSISFDKDNNEYVITRINGFKPNNDKIKNYYYKLNSYDIDNDNKTITIKENFMFVNKEYSDNDKDITSIKLYRDIYQEDLIKEIDYPTNDFIKKFKFDDYAKDSGIITYTFKMDEENNYYFYSSKIES